MTYVTRKVAVDLNVKTVETIGKERKNQRHMHVVLDHEVDHVPAHAHAQTVVTETVTETTETEEEIIDVQIIVSQEVIAKTEMIGIERTQHTQTNQKTSWNKYCKAHVKLLLPSEKIMVSDLLRIKGRFR